MLINRLSSFSQWFTSLPQKARPFVNKIASLSPLIHKTPPSAHFSTKKKLRSNLSNSKLEGAIQHSALMFKKAEEQVAKQQEYDDLLTSNSLMFKDAEFEVRPSNFHPQAIFDSVYVIPNNDQIKAQEVQANLNHAKMAVELLKRAKRAKTKVASKTDLEFKDVMREYNLAVKSGNQERINQCIALLAKGSE